MPAYRKHYSCNEALLRLAEDCKKFSDKKKSFVQHLWFA